MGRERSSSGPRSQRFRRGQRSGRWERSAFRRAGVEMLTQPVLVTVAAVAYGPEPAVYVGVAGLHVGVAIDGVRRAGEKFSAGQVLQGGVLGGSGDKAAAVEPVVAHVGSGVWSRPTEDDCGCGYVVPGGQPAGRLWDTLNDCGSRDGGRRPKSKLRVLAYMARTRYQVGSFPEQPRGPGRR